MKYSISFGYHGRSHDYFVEVPDNFTREDLNQELRQKYLLLSRGWTEDVSPTELLSEVCDANGWKWEEFSFDLDFEDMSDLGEEMERER